MVGIGPRNVNSLRLEELLCWNQTLWRELIVAKATQQLAHKNITLHVFDLNVAHVSRDKPHSILQVLVDDHVPQGDDCIWVLVQGNDLDISLSRLGCRQGSPDQRAATCSKVQHDNLFVLKRQVYGLCLALGLLIGRGLLHQDVLALFLLYRERWVLDDTGAFSLHEFTMALHVPEGLSAGFLVELILDRVIFKCLVRRSLEVVCKWLQR